METKGKRRKNYNKPQINQVNLVIKEAVLQACKTGEGALGKGLNTCNFAACKKGIYGS